MKYKKIEVNCRYLVQLAIAVVDYEYSKQRTFDEVFPIINISWQYSNGNWT